jgi:hypothetical protein
MRPIDISPSKSTTELKWLFASIAEDRTHLYKLACEKLRQKKEGGQREIPLPSMEISNPPDPDPVSLDSPVDVSSIMEDQSQFELDSLNWEEYYDF